MLNMVHNKLTAKCEHYKGMVYSQIMPVVRFPTFVQKDQWWAEDARQMINKLVYEHTENHYNQILPNRSEYLLGY